MTTSPDPRPAPGHALDTAAPAAPRPVEAEPVFEPNSVDPDDYEWRPVPRRPRADGWTPEVQQNFIAALADTGLVERAAQAVDMSVQSAYRLRRAPGAEGFSRAWTAALAAAAQRVVDLAFQSAIEGEEIPVYDRDGCRVGVRYKINTRMAMFLMRAYQPERFRFAHHDVRQPGERAAPPALPMAEAIQAIGPQVPPDPHLLLEPACLDERIWVADEIAAMDAALPVDHERELYACPPVEPDHPEATARRIARQRRDAEGAQR